jgi:N-acetylmuramoyl-L-alanine amidase
VALTQASATPLRLGDHGPLVTALRDQLARVGHPAAGGDSREPAQEFDAGVDRAVRAFQQERGLIADGIVGAQTARALDAARWQLGDRILLFTPGHPMRGDDVAALQERLVVLGLHAGPVRGVFGTETEGAVRELQGSLGLRADGVVGPVTLRGLSRLKRSVSGGDAWALREQAHVAVAGKSLAGKVVLLDPAHGGDDPGALANGLAEAEIVFDLATRVEGRLAATGVTAVLTRSPGLRPDVQARADLAREVGADVVICLHCDAHASPDARGVATYYWGDARVGSSSAVGSRLAGLIQREIVARTDVLDCRTHARTFDVLRMTSMPAVRVDVGYLTNPQDACRLADPGFRDLIADALVVAVQRLYLDEEDAVTGSLNLGDVLAHAGRAP